MHTDHALIDHAHTGNSKFIKKSDYNGVAALKVDGRLVNDSIPKVRRTQPAFSIGFHSDICHFCKHDVTLPFSAHDATYQGYCPRCAKVAEGPKSQQGLWPR